MTTPPLDYEEFKATPRLTATQMHQNDWCFEYSARGGSIQLLNVPLQHSLGA
jgi:hypothetical protein